MEEAMARIFTLAFMMLLYLSNQVGGNDNCPLGSSNLIRMCQPVTVTNKNRYTMEFSDFELTDEDSCQCSFIAPSHGNFEMSPTSFIPVNNCGTKVEIKISNVVIPGGRVECNRSPFLTASVVHGENITVIVSRTSMSSKITPYCYVASFPVSVTFTCTGVLQTTSSSSSQATSFTTTAITTTKATKTITTMISTTTTKVTTTPAAVSSSSPTSPTATNPSSTSDILKGQSTAGNEESFPVVIVIPAAVGAVVVIILIIIVAVVCSRRSRSTKQTTTGGYENEVFNDKDSSSDGIKDNILYNGMGDVPHWESGGDGHYSSVIRHSIKLDEEPHNTKQLSKPANQQAETQGPVYAEVDKSQKRPSGPPVASKPSKSAQNDSTAAPVYAVPDKSQKSKQKVNSEYDVPQNNSPVPSQPLRTSNQDGLLYSEVQHVGPIPDLPTRKSDSKPANTVIYSEIRTEL